MTEEDIAKAYAGKLTKVTTKVNDGELVLEYGRFAEQATSAVFATLGDTQVLSIATVGEERDADYFPMSVEFRERLYSGGKIKGSRWIKREGRPSDDEVLAGRLIDRSARPLFPKYLRKDLQIINLVLSVDGVHDPVLLAANATFAALAISPLPWAGPVAAVRVGMKEGELVLHPVYEEIENSDLDLIVSASEDKVVMIEAGGNQVPEDKMLEAIEMAHKGAQPILEAINELVKQVGKPKIESAEPTHDAKLLEEVDKMVSAYLKDKAKEKQEPTHTDIWPEIEEKFATDHEIKDVNAAFEKVWKKLIRKMIKEGRRPDGRKTDEIRPIGADVGLLKRTHGSGIFRRGSTHVLSITALQPPDYSQIIETASTEEVKRFIHYYSMPPYATGETGRLGLGRREIGHGALAEKALRPVIPSLEEFPYTIMVMSEVMSSNGSTSMGSTCGTTLSLMDAGVPIKAPVSGIAMGLIHDGPEGPMILTDIAGIEDFNGDMDFKVAGTEQGITAIQLDIKVHGLELDLVKEVIARARTARMEIMQKMLKVIPAPRDQVSAYAPKVAMIQIPVDKIGEVIGPGGRTIRQIVSETGADVDVEDDGKVMVSSTETEKMEKAVEWVKALTTDPEVGQKYTGKVTRIVPFGAFVEILPGKDGLVHVSRMGAGYVERPEDVVKEGDTAEVEVQEIDEFDRVNLTLLSVNGKPIPSQPDSPGGSHNMTRASQGPFRGSPQDSRSSQQRGFRDRRNRQDSRDSGRRGGRRSDRNSSRGRRRDERY